MTSATATDAPPAGLPQSADELRQRLSAGVDEAWCAFTAAAQGAREDLYALTMSGLGGCTRQAAYRLARTPPSEEAVFGPMREANIGTMIHLGWLPYLAQVLDGRDEIAVTLHEGELTIDGRSDLYVEPLGAVVDLKTIGTYKFAGGFSDVVNRSHRLQVAGYAKAVVQSGRPVWWVAWIYLDRSSGAHHVVVEPYGEELEALVADRCAELEAYAAEPDAAPRDERGPGLSIVCDGCPWLRECWGADARAGEVGAQRILIHDHDGVADALRLYDEARARVREAEADKEFARAMFSSYEPGAYGEFEFRLSAEGDSVDKDAAVRMLREAGIEPPRKPTGRRLTVKRARTAD